MSLNPAERRQATTRQTALRKTRPPRRRQPPEAYLVVIECRDEPQQRWLYEQFQSAGVKVRLLVI